MTRAPYCCVNHVHYHVSMQSFQRGRRGRRGRAVQEEKYPQVHLMRDGRTFFRVWRSLRLTLPLYIVPHPHKTRPSSTRWDLLPISAAYGLCRRRMSSLVPRALPRLQARGVICLATCLLFLDLMMEYLNR